MTSAKSSSGLLRGSTASSSFLMPISWIYLMSFRRLLSHSGARMTRFELCLIRLTKWTHSSWWGSTVHLCGRWERWSTLQRCCGSTLAPSGPVLSETQRIEDSLKPRHRIFSGISRVSRRRLLYGNSMISLRGQDLQR